MLQLFNANFNESEQQEVMKILFKEKVAVAETKRINLLQFLKLSGIRVPDKYKSNYKPVQPQAVKVPVVVPNV